MEQIIRKMNLSIITCMLVLILSVTTTYAWAGLQNYSNIENIDFNLESSETYAIQVSLDGISFSNEIKEIDLKEAILRNMGIITKEEVSDSEINSLMEDVILDPLSTKRVGNELGAFVSIDDIRRKDFNYDTHVETKKVREAYFNFDIYVSLKYSGGYEDDFYLKSFQEIYVSNLSELLIGNNKTYKLKSDHVLEKYFMDTYKESPYYVMLYEGVYGSLITGFMAIPLSYTTCKWSKSICNRYGKYFSLEILKEDLMELSYWGFNLSLFLGGIICNIFTRLAIEAFSPCHQNVSDCLSSLLLLFFEQEFTNALKLFPGVIFVTLGSLIHSEIIIVHICGLSENTKKEINVRSASDIAISLRLIDSKTVGSRRGSREGIQSDPFM